MQAGPGRVVALLVLLGALLALGWLAGGLFEDPGAGAGPQVLRGPGADDEVIQRAAPVQPPAAAPVGGDVARAPVESEQPLDPGRATGPSAPVAGRLTSALDGAPVQEAVLRLRPAGDDRGWTALPSRRVRSPGGAFDLGPWPAGAYTLRVTAGDHQPLEVGLTVPGAEALELVLPVRAVVAGRVLEAGGGPAVAVELVLRPLGEGGPAFTPRARSDDQGRFRFVDLEPGAWVLEVPDPHRAAPLLRSEPLDLSASSVVRRDLVLPPAASLAVSVRCDGLPAPPGLRLRLVGGEPGLPVLLATVRAGRAHFDRLPPGRYELAVEHPGGVEVRREPLDLTAGPTTWQVEVPAPATAPGDG